MITEGERSPVRPRERHPRVGLYLPNLHGGGAERVMVTVAGGLARRGVPVDLVLARAEGPYLAEVPPDVRIVDLGASGVLASLPRLASYLRGERPSAMLATLPHANVALWWARRLARVPVRVYMREATARSIPKRSSRGLRQRVMPHLVRRYYRRADGVVAVSEGVARDLETNFGVPGAKIATIYNPVVGRELEARAAEPLEHPWFAPGQPPVVLGVGRLIPEKGFLTLLRAFALLRRQREARLVLLGEGSYRAELEREVEDLQLGDSVSMPGFVPNPFPFMAAASLYVLSSEREGLPGSLIQAMACGCPVVATDCPTGPAEVLEGGRYGPLVPVGEAPALARAMADTLARPPDRELLRGRGRQFDAERSIDAYLRLLCPDAPPPAARSERAAGGGQPAGGGRPTRS